MSKPVLIDVTRLLIRLSQLKRPTGIDRVCLAYVEYFKNHALAVLSFRSRVIVLNKQQTIKLFTALLAEQPIRSKTYWLSLLLGYMLSGFKSTKSYKDHYYFNLSHKGLECPAYIRKISKLGFRTIFFIHDLIPITHPEYCRENEDKLHIQRMQRAIKIATGIIVNSSYTQLELNRFIQQNKLPQPPITIAWLSAELEACQTSATISLPQAPYFVLLSTIEARKNHYTILQVWLRLIEKYGSDCPKLVILGQRGWECEQVFDLLDRSVRLKSHVLEINTCNDTDLQHVLKNSQALIFPSFVEGYGIPLVEALSLSVPVLASDIAVFREIGQNIPEFIDPIDANKWQQMIENYMYDHNQTRSAQLNRLAKYNHWQWSDHFINVEHFLQQLDVNCNHA